MAETKDKLSIEQLIVEAAGRSILKLFNDGSLIAPDYANRVKIPADLVQRIYAQIDYDKVVKIMGAQINEMVASRITRAMTEELTSDIKHVLSHEPTRLRLRGVVAAELLSIKSEHRSSLPGITAAEMAQTRPSGR
jgi:uncharacterized membrane protein YheB (UPF0754 family)